MKILDLGSLDIVLSFYHSYSLPLYSMTEEDGCLIIEKIYGVCPGLLCKYCAGKSKCLVPSNCPLNIVFDLLGISIYEEVISITYRELGIREDNLFAKMTIPTNKYDKLAVLITVFLSRNTDYYRNTIRWINDIMSKNCLIDIWSCHKIIRSYQFSQLIRIWDELKKISEIKDPITEAKLLLGLKNIGLKTVNAYLLHSHGLTMYAPIDRYYGETLKKLGISGRIIDKTKCQKYFPEHSLCPYNEKCIYAKTIKYLGLFNGVLQSITYIVGRLRRLTTKKTMLSPLEEIMTKRLYAKKHVLLQDYNEIIEKTKRYLEKLPNSSKTHISRGRQ